MEKLKVKVNGKIYEVEVEFEGHVSSAPVKQSAPNNNSRQPVNPSSSPSSDGSGVQAPIAGVVKEVKVKPGDSVEENQVVVILEAMKMNTNVVSEFSGKVKNISVNVGDSVRQGQILIELE